MTLRSLALAAVMVLSTMAAPALAQTPSGTGPSPGVGDSRGGAVDRERARTDDEAVRNTATRRTPRAAAAAAAAAPVDAVPAATAQAQTAGLTCTLSGANALGNTGAGEAYEVTCDNGVGYIIAPGAAGAAPQAFNCLVMATNAARAKAEDPNSDLVTCALPANQNAIAMVTPAATAAGLGCTIDAATWVGRNPDGKDRFEVGCAGLDGAWVEATQVGAEPGKIDCFEIVKAGRTCSFTTAAEQAATMQAWLASGQSPACTVEEAKYIGRNAQGRFYEAKCAGADGVIARVDTSGALGQTWACAGASHVLGGCTLTTAVPAAAPQE